MRKLTLPGLLLLASPPPATDNVVVIRAARMIDGRGNDVVKPGVVRR